MAALKNAVLKTSNNITSPKFAPLRSANFGRRVAVVCNCPPTHAGVCAC